MRSSVVLPAPFGPSTTIDSPAASSAETPARATRSPYSRRSPSRYALIALSHAADFSP